MAAEDAAEVAEEDAAEAAEELAAGAVAGDASLEAGDAVAVLGVPVSEADAAGVELSRGLALVGEELGDELAVAAPTAVGWAGAPAADGTVGVAAGDEFARGALDGGAPAEGELGAGGFAGGALAGGGFGGGVACGGAVQGSFFSSEGLQSGAAGGWSLFGGGVVAAGGAAFCAGGFWAGASCAANAPASSKQATTHRPAACRLVSIKVRRFANCIVRLITGCASLRNPRVPPEPSIQSLRSYNCKPAYSPATLPSIAGKLT